MVNSMCNISAGFSRDGKAERDVEIIRTMLRKKRTVQEISELTDIPIEEVERVKKIVLSQ